MFETHAGRAQSISGLLSEDIDPTHRRAVGQLSADLFDGRPDPVAPCACRAAVGGSSDYGAPRHRLQPSRPIRASRGTAPAASRSRCATLARQRRSVVRLERRDPEAAAGRSDSRESRASRIATPRSISAGEHRAFYVGFANGVIWPLFHYGPACPSPSPRLRRLSRVNRLRAPARAAAAARRHGLGARLSPDPARRPAAPAQCPAPHRLLPAHPLPAAGAAGPAGARSTDRRLLGYDLVGFQTADDVHRLRAMSATRSTSPADGTGRVEALGQSCRVAAFPIGIDADVFRRMAADPAGRAWKPSGCATVCASACVIGVDRLDYTKGLPQRLEAFLGPCWRLAGAPLRAQPCCRSRRFARRCGAIPGPPP